MLSAVLAAVLNRFQQSATNDRADVVNLSFNYDLKQNLQLILVHKQQIFGSQKSIPTMNSKTDMPITVVAVASSRGSADDLLPDLDSNAHRNTAVLARMAVSEK